jgi:hypothetical protein
MHLDLTDDEASALVKHLRRDASRQPCPEGNAAVECDPFALTPHLDPPLLLRPGLGIKGA